MKPLPMSLAHSLDGITIHRIIEQEGPLFDAQGRRAGQVRENGVAEMLDFKFGFPTAIRLRDGSYLATWWSVEDPSGRSGVRWAKLRVDL